AAPRSHLFRDDRNETGPPGTPVLGRGQPRRPLHRLPRRLLRPRGLPDQSRRDLRRARRRLREPPHRRPVVPLPAGGGRRGPAVAGTPDEPGRPPAAVAVVGLLVAATQAGVPKRPSCAPASRCRWIWNTVWPPSRLQFMTMR